MSAGRRQRRREEEAARQAQEAAELAARPPLHSLDLPIDASEQLLRRRRRIQTAEAFVEALYDLREAVAREPSAHSSTGLLTYGTALADDGRLYALSQPRLSLEVHQLLEELEEIWARLQPEERRVLHLGRDYGHAAIVVTLRAERVRTALGGPPTDRWVRLLIERAHRKIEDELRRWRT